jgi:hypothetical protein
MKHAYKLIYVILMLFFCVGISSKVFDEVDISANAKQNASIPEIKKIDHFMRITPQDKDWMEKLGFQAAERSISVDSILTLSAEYIINGKNNSV